MACVRKRLVGKGFRWVLDYRDQQGRRHWETTKGNRKEAEQLLAERVREISRGTYRAPAVQVTFEELGSAYLKHSQANVRPNTFGASSPAICPPTSRPGRCGTSAGPTSKTSGRTYSMGASGRAPSTRP